MRVRPAALIVQAETLLTLRYNYNGTDVYMLPGGNMEFGENMQTCLARELQEELGVDTREMKLIFIAEVHQPTVDKLHCVFVTKLKPTIEPYLNPAETSALEIVYLPFDKISKVALYPHIPEQIHAYCISKKFPENQFIGEIQQVVY